MSAARLDAGGVPPGPGPVGRLNRVGVLFGALALYALALQPFVTFRPNRIAAGKALGLLAAAPEPAGALGLAVFAIAVLANLWRPIPAGGRAVAATVALVALIILAGLVPAHLTVPTNTIARVSVASGFWLAFLAFGLLTAGGLADLRPRPVTRLLLLAGAAALAFGLLASGRLAGLSVLKEYAAHADTFGGDALKHVELSFGTLVAAVLAGLPLGLACAVLPRLRAVTLPVLNVIQTVPSIAMYGLMMVPLGLLAARLPVLSDLGIRGIGTAPAAIALFLYSLLPVVANTVTGLAEVPAAAREAARGMGMSARQRLLRVEVPLAAPVILTGIRIVLVQNIGLVTVAALIGGGGLGTFVFQGIGQAAIDLVLLGAIPIIALAFAAAVVLDAVVDLTRSVPL